MHPSRQRGRSSSVNRNFIHIKFLINEKEGKVVITGQLPEGTLVSFSLRMHIKKYLNGLWHKADLPFFKLTKLNG